MVLAVSPRRAESATDTFVRLDYRADSQGRCVGEDELRRMVVDQLGRDPFRPEADQHVAITIANTDAGFQARIVWTTADGRRAGERLLSSRSRDCHEIAANVAFAVALQLQLLDRAAPNDAAPPSPDTAPPNTTETAPPKTTDTAPPKTSDATPPKTGNEGTAAAPAEPPPPPGEAQAVPAAPARPRVRLAVGAGPALAIGMTPSPTALGRLFVAARVERFSAEIAADAALPVTQRESDHTGVAVNAMGAGAAGCGHVSLASACVVGRVGWIRARGVDITTPSTSWGHFGEVGVRLAASEELGRFLVSVHADALVMLSRWNVVLNDAVVWSVPRVGGMVGVDVALRFF
jgi:hypothetical protein